MSSETLQSRLVPPRHQADPYPYYARLRTSDPVHRSAGGFWILTRYDDVDAVLRARRFGPVDRRPDEPPDPAVWPGGRDWLRELESRCRESVDVRSSTIGLTQLWLTNLEPPRHTVVRRLLQMDFSADAISQQRSRIAGIAEELLDGVADEPEFDLMSRFAVPLPAYVICEVIGVPRADWDRLLGWARALTPALAGDSAGDVRDAASQATLALARYFEEAMEERLRHPRTLPSDRLVPRLAQAVAEGSMAPRDAVAQCLMLLFAGLETTANLIGNGLLALLRHPEAFHRLREMRTISAVAIEELLRYDTPVQFTIRVARRETVIGDRTIAVGDHLALGLGAANRDPARFPDPDRLLIDRDPNPHLGFGSGLHHCLGARMARVEVEIAIGKILRRLPSLELADEPEWTSGGPLRGLAALRVRRR